MSQYFPKPYEPFGKTLMSKLIYLIIATKTDLKNVSPVDVNSFALNQI